MATFANQVKTPDKKMQDILLKTWLLLMSLFCGNCFSTYVHHCCCIVIGVTVLTCFALH